MCEPRCRVDSDETVHPLNRTARGSLGEVVDAREDDGVSSFDRYPNATVVGADNILQAYWPGLRCDKRRVGKDLVDRVCEFLGAHGICQTGEHSGVNSSGKGAGVRDEVEAWFEAIGRDVLKQASHLMCVPVFEGFVGAKTTVSFGVVRTDSGCATTPCASGDGGDTDRFGCEIGLDEPGCGQGNCGREAARLGYAVQVCVRGEVGQAEVKITEALGRRVRCAVNRLKLRGVAEPEVSGQVNAVELALSFLRFRKECVNVAG